MHRHGLRRMKEDLNVVIERLLPKIKKMAKRFHAKFPSVAADDFEQVGKQGLVKALEKKEYDPSRGKLETMAHPWIQGEMQMHVRQELSLTRFDREASAAVESLFQGQASGISNPKALAARVSELAEDYALSVFQGRTPEDEMVMKETAAAVAAFMSELPERDSELLRLRCIEECSCAEVGEVLGMSASAALRAETKLREQLRRRVARGG